MISSKIFIASLNQQQSNAFVIQRFWLRLVSSILRQSQSTPFIKASVPFKPRHSLQFALPRSLFTFSPQSLGCRVIPRSYSASAAINIDEFLRKQNKTSFFSSRSILLKSGISASFNTMAEANLIRNKGRWKSKRQFNLISKYLLWKRKRK